jgi:hypothetical protein
MDDAVVKDIGERAGEDGRLAKERLEKEWLLLQRGRKGWIRN